VWKVLSRFIGEHEIDLIVVGTHGRTGAKKLLMGSVAEKIFRQANCPVLSIGPNVPCQPEGEIKFKQILFATNFGEESLAALPYAISLAEENQSQLTLLHVVEPVGAFDEEAVRAAAIRRLREMAPSEAEPWCRVELLVEIARPFAPPAERILEVAREHAADLIVLGARPMQGAMSAVTHLTHTTDQSVVAQAACPVLTVRG
jgi:nucleotide-binding universal stress UspA family protein